MLQVIDGIPMYVVEFDAMPELPITGRNRKERVYASALTSAILDGIITEPGKYGIHVDKKRQNYCVHKITE